ncbi:MAG: NAD(P)/FAD-dependent oxidoreductase [Bacillota bacterium]|nr:NAD(P)/FAD-dependent oxidoreductase [Bacillota bacterium]
MYDVCIIGAGIIGCSIARELSKYNLNICVLEKESDISVGTLGISKANSAIIHSGFDVEPGTLKSKFIVEGNYMFDKLSKELDFPFRRNGSLVLCFNTNKIPMLNLLKEQGDENSVPGLMILDKDQVLEMEPSLSHNVVAGLYAPTGSIVCPFEMTIAYAENAYTNGVQFKFNTEVLDIEKKPHYFVIKTEQYDIDTKIVINAAGLFSDILNNMVSNNKISIVTKKGDYCLFDKAAGKTVRSTIFQLPTELGKGVLVTPTINGNLIIGPNASDSNGEFALNNTFESIDEILLKAKTTLNNVPSSHVVSLFSGLRAHSTTDDFIIGESEDVKNFINAAAIGSSGLSSTPAIASYIEDLVVSKLNPKKNKNYNPIRKAFPKLKNLTDEQKQTLTKEDPAYAKIICKCENVTEGEILHSIHRPLGATTIEGILRRTGAGMGRCKSCYCNPKLVKILARELNVSEEEIINSDDILSLGTFSSN